MERETRTKAKQNVYAKNAPVIGVNKSSTTQKRGSSGGEVQNSAMTKDAMALPSKKTQKVTKEKRNKLSQTSEVKRRTISNSMQD